MKDQHKGYRVFMFAETPPTECKCGCGGFQRLFTYEEQMKNYESKGAYRIFANDSHKNKYAKTAPEL